MNLTNYIQKLLLDQRGFFGSATAGVDTETISNYINGFITSNDTDTDHDISFGAGGCVDSTNAVVMSTNSAIVKRIDAAWAVGTGNGGLFSGSVAADTWYHMFAIRKANSTVADFGFDTDVGAANIPTDYTLFRRIGSVLTDGSANIIQYKQIGEYFLWLTVQKDVDVSTLGTARTLYTLSTPPDVNCMALFNIGAVKTGSKTGIGITSPDQTEQALTIALGTYSIYENDVTSSISFHGPKAILTNTSSQIGVRGLHASTDLDIGTVGYIDFRGKS